MTDFRPRWLPVVACAAALGAPAMAQDDGRVLEAFFARYDRNGDGRVERSEFPGSDAQFSELDEDASGGVDFAEFARSELARRLLGARKKGAVHPPPSPRSTSIATATSTARIASWRSGSPTPCPGRPTRSFRTSPSASTRST